MRNILRVPEPFPGADSCGSKAIATAVKFTDGGPAFPQPMVDNQGRVDSAWSYGEGGMTLRDYFAASALSTAPMVDSDSIAKTGTELAVKATAQWAYRVADAMIVERAKGQSV